MRGGGKRRQKKVKEEWCLGKTTEVGPGERADRKKKGELGPFSWDKVNSRPAENQWKRERKTLRRKGGAGAKNRSQSKVEWKNRKKKLQKVHRQNRKKETGDKG